MRLYISVPALVLVCLALPSQQISAQSVMTVVDPATAKTLLAGGDIRAASVGRDAHLSLAPSHPAVDRFIAELSAEQPDVLVEALFLWERPSPIEQAEETLLVYNVLRSIGSLQGIEYWSASRQTMRLFYEYSSLIISPENPSPVGDVRLSSLPAEPETLYARQKDLSFGDNLYRIRIESGPGFVTQHSTNLTTMRYAFIPVAAPGRVRVRLLSVSVDEGVLFYAVSSAKATVVPGIRNKLEASFGNRAAAVYDWFSREASATWAAPRSR